MKKLLLALVLLASPAWGQSYDYIIQSEISAENADMQSQHEEMARQQEEMRNEMEQTRLEMSEQRLQNAIDKANADDYRRYH